MYTRKKQYITLAILVAAVITLSIGFAAFSNLLTINPQALHSRWVMSKRLGAQNSFLVNISWAIWKTKIEPKIIPLIKNVIFIT